MPNLFLKLLLTQIQKLSMNRRSFAFESSFIFTQWIHDSDMNNDGLCSLFTDFEKKTIKKHFPSSPHIPYITIEHVFFCDVILEIVVDFAS